MTEIKGISSFSGSLPEKGQPEAIGTAPGLTGSWRRGWPRRRACLKLRMVRAAALGWGREACHPTKRLLQQDIVTRGKVQGVAWEGDVLAKKPQNILHEKVSVSLAHCRTVFCLWDGDAPHCSSHFSVPSSGS